MLQEKRRGNTSDMAASVSFVFVSFFSCGLPFSLLLFLPCPPRCIPSILSPLGALCFDSLLSAETPLPAKLVQKCALLTLFPSPPFSRLVLSAAHTQPNARPPTKLARCAALLHCNACSASQAPLQPTQTNKQKQGHILFTVIHSKPQNANGVTPVSSPLPSSHPSINPAPSPWHPRHSAPSGPRTCPGGRTAPPTAPRSGGPAPAGRGRPGRG